MQVLSPAPYLSVEERQSLSTKNDVKAAIGIIYHWFLILFALGLAYYFPNPIVMVISLFIIGGQQLACAILMHDAGHYAVFNSKRLNDWFGNWFGGYPIFQDMSRYRAYHLTHHLNTGLEEDPDLLLTRGYPTTRQSMIRKFSRDLFGITGSKALAGLVMMQLGYIEYNLGNKVVRTSQKDRSWTEFFKTFMNKLGGPIAAQLILLSIMTLSASPWLYLLWIGAYISTFQLSLRVRAMAEHSMVEDSTDPYANTRTTKANWIEQLLFAPYHVNYHAEHHMMMSVPSYHLPRMHHLLMQRGFYEKGNYEKNYWTIVKKAASQ